MDTAYNLLKEAEQGHIAVPIVIAPTGYGKTRASPEIYTKAAKEGIGSGLIHVAPLRSLVYKIYTETFKEYGGAYQMHTPEASPEKSPYYLKPLVVTTIDTYLWNLYRVPILEFSTIEKGLSQGHYYPVYTAIFTSINVFDEAHLYLGEGNPELNIEAVKTATSTLARTATPQIIETATLRPSALKDLYSSLRSAKGRPKVITLACDAKRLKNNIKPKDVIGVEDEDWIHENHLSWDTKLASSWDSVINDMISLTNEGAVLAVANTVKQAVDLYRKIKEKIGESNVILIHGRLTDEERKEREDKITDIKTGIIIATQVIEAGVDVNAIAVYTEAAPIENLVQRSGRACRRGDSLIYCQNNKAKLTIITNTMNNNPIYDPANVKTTIELIKHALETKGSINWRTPCKINDNEVPYTLLIEEVDHRLRTKRPRSKVILSSILESYLLYDGQPEGILKLLQDSNICSIFRNTIMTPIDTPYGQITASLKWILTHSNKLLETGENNAPIIIIKTIEGQSKRGVKEIARGEAIQLMRAWESKSNCYKLYTALTKDIENIVKGITLNRRITWVFLAKKNAYTPGEGLIPNGVT